MLDQAARLREIAHSVSAQENTTHKAVYTEKIAPKNIYTDKKHGRIVAVTSGKGGVGKTNTVINTALLLAKMNKKVVIVDLDLGLANVDILLNIAPKYNIEDVLKGRKQVEDVLIAGPRGIKVLAGGSGVAGLADLGDDERNNFINSFIALKEQFDYVLLDTAAGISKNVIEFVLIADDVIVVTTPEPTAITDAYAAIKVIGSRNKDIDIHMLFNMVKTTQEAEHYFKKIQQVIQQFLNLKVNSLGAIMYDSCVRQSIMKRKPFSLLYPYSYASRSLSIVARNMIKHTMEQSTAVKKNLFEKVATIFA